jgi:hypothetical protein
MITNEENLNTVIREHETMTADWNYHELAQELYKWFDLFNAEFFDGQLPTCFLQIDPTRPSRLGHYRRGRNGVGARHEINLNSQHLEDRSLYKVLGTLLHEMTHEWEELFGKPGHRNYHTKVFTQRCAAMGIPCTGGYRSYTTGYTDPFLTLLKRNGVDVEKQAITTAEPEPTIRNQGRSTLKLWMCECTRIRAAVEIKAWCMRCDRPFVKME